MSSILDRFEQWVILSTTRAVFTLLGVLAGTTFAIAIAVSVYAWAPRPPPLPAPTPTPPAVPEVSWRDVVTELDQAVEQEDAEADGWDGEEPPTIGGDPEIAQLVERIASRFNLASYPWRDQIERRCAYQSYYGCLRWDDVVVAKGVMSAVTKAVEGKDRPEQLAILRAVDRISAAGTDEKAHHLGVVAVLDMIGAAGRVPTDAVEALAGVVVSTETVKPDARVVGDVLTAVIRIRKRGADEAVLVRWLKATPTLWGLFGSPDASGADQHIPGLIVTWSIVSGGHAATAEGRMAALQKVAREVPPARAVEILDAWGARTRGEALETEIAYTGALAAAEAEQARIVAEYEQAASERLALGTLAATVTVGALGALAIVGLLLALLAVERNTRATRERVAKLQAPLPS